MKEKIKKFIKAEVRFERKHFMLFENINIIIVFTIFILIYFVGLKEFKNNPNPKIPSYVYWGSGYLMAMIMGTSIYSSEYFSKLSRWKRINYKSKRIKCKNCEWYSRECSSKLTCVQKKD